MEGQYYSGASAIEPIFSSLWAPYIKNGKATLGDSFEKQMVS